MRFFPPRDVGRGSSKRHSSGRRRREARRVSQTKKMQSEPPQALRDHRRVFAVRAFGAAGAQS
jgi:hypothetical protein